MQLGKEAAAEVERKMPVLRNAEVDGYLNNILNRLKQSPQAEMDVHPDIDIRNQVSPGQSFDLLPLHEAIHTAVNDVANA